MEPAFQRFTAIGTVAAVGVTDPPALAPAVDAVRDQVAQCDLACSRFRADSELARLNASAGEPVEVSQRLLDEILAAIRAARVTDGLVDPTVGHALVSLGYDRDFPLVLSSEAPVTVAFQPVPGWRALTVDDRRRRVTVPKGVEVDLGATAKARCADLAAVAANEAAGCGVLVSLGGDVAVAGAAPDGGWAIRVTDSSHAGPDAPGQTVSVESGGLATSSVTVRSWHRSGTDLHHVIDPRTGLPAQVVWRTVSVTAGCCADANTASTAAIVLGAQAPAWLEKMGLPGRLVDPDGAVIRVAGWPAESGAT